MDTDTSVTVPRGDMTSIVNNNIDDNVYKFSSNNPVSAVKKVLSEYGTAASTIMGMSNVSQVIDGLQAQAILSAHASEQNRPLYLCKSVATEEDLSKLRKKYPTIRIESKLQDPVGTHPYSREVRAIDTDVTFKRDIGYSNEVVLEDGYDVYVKDVGGYMPYHDQRGHKLVHVCNPILDHKDVIRNAEVEKYISRYSADARESSLLHPHVSDKTNKLNKLTCNQRSQDCKCKAPVCTFIHSVYDISLDDFRSILDTAHAQTAYVIMHYTNDTIFKQSGRFEDHNCAWSKIKMGKEPYIKFDFDGDASGSYTHKLKDYHKFTRINFLKTHNGRMFAIQRHLSSDILYMTFHLVKHQLEKVILNHVLPFDSSNDDIYLFTWYYNAYASRSDFMRPVVIKTTSQFYNDILVYAGTLRDTKFTIDNVKSFALSQSKTITTGSHHHKPVKNPPAEIHIIAYTAYLAVYEQNYASSKAVQLITKDAADVRERCLYTEGIVKFFVRLYNWNYGRKLHPYEGQNSDGSFMFPADIETKIEDHMNKFGEKTYFRTLVDYLDSFVPNFSRKYPIVASGVRVLAEHELADVESYLIARDELCVAHKVSKHGAVNSDFTRASGEFQEMIKIDPDLQYIVRVVKEDVKLIKRGQDETELATAFRVQGGCFSRFDTVPVEGDGNCFFWAVKKGLDLKESPDEIRSRLKESKFLYLVNATVDHERNLIFNSPATQALVRQLDPVDDPSDSSRWADSSVVLLMAFEYNITICVHSQVSNIIYNPSRSDAAQTCATVHLSHSGVHYDLLVRNLDQFEPCLVSTIPAGAPTEYFELDEGTGYDDLFGPVLVEAADKKLAIAKHYRTYASGNNPFYDLKNYGFSSMYGPMLHIAKSQLVPPPEGTDQYKILDVNTENKSSLQAHCDVDFHGITPDVFAFDIARIKPVVVSNRSPVRTICYPSMEIFKKNFRTEQFDLICVNPNFYSDELGLIVPFVYDEYLHKRLTVMSHLRFGGDFIVAVPMPFTAYVASVAYELSLCFSEVKCVYPKVSPVYLPWCFLVCSRRNNVEFRLFKPLDVTRGGNFKVSEDIMAVLLSMTNEFIDLLTRELESIVNKTYRPFEKEVLGKYASFIPTRSVPVNFNHLGGFDLPNIPSSDKFTTSDDVLKFSREWILESFPGVKIWTLSTKGGKPVLDDIVRNFSFHVSEHMLKKYHIGTNIVEGIKTFSRIMSDQSSDEIEFARRYFFAYYVAKTRGKPFPLLNLSDRDLGKHISTLSFYDVGFFQRSSYYLRDLASKLGDYISPPRLDITPSPDIRRSYRILEKIPRLERNKFSLHELVKECSMIDDTDLRKPYVESTDDSKSGFLQKPHSGEYWDENCYSASPKKRFDYYREFIDLCKYTTENIEGSVKAICGVIRNFGNVDGRKEDPFIGNTLTNPLVRLRGSIVKGNASQLEEHRRYIMTFEADPDKVVNVQMVNVSKYRKPDYEEHKNFIACDELNVLIEKDIYETAVKFKLDEQINVAHDIVSIQAGPGCGKTFTVIDNLVKDFNSNDMKMLGVFKSVMTADSVRDKLLKRFEALKVDMLSAKKYAMARVLTIDGLLKTGCKPLIKYSKVMVDEAMMHHPGKIVALSAVLDSGLDLYGDTMQIGFIDRTNFNAKYCSVSKAFPVVECRTTSWRVTRSVAWYLSKYYEPLLKGLGKHPGDVNKCLLTKNKIDRGENLKLINNISDVDRKSDYTYLTFNQADKASLDLHLNKGARKYKIATIHEFQGEECDHVAIVRLTRSDTSKLFCNVPHIITGVSRHTKTLMYYTIDDTDALSNDIRSMMTSTRIIAGIYDSVKPL